MFAFEIMKKIVYLSATCYFAKLTAVHLNSWSFDIGKILFIPKDKIQSIFLNIFRNFLNLSFDKETFQS